MLGGCSVWPASEAWFYLRDSPCCGHIAICCFRWHLALGRCRPWPNTGLGSRLSKPLDPANSSRISFPSLLWPGQPSGHTLHLTVPVSVTYPQSALWPRVWTPRVPELWQRMPHCLGRSLASPYPLTPHRPSTFSLVSLTQACCPQPVVGKICNALGSGL